MSVSKQQDNRSVTTNGQRLSERQQHGANQMKNGLHIKYSPINQAFFLMWYGTILQICDTKAIAKAEMDILLRNATE